MIIIPGYHPIKKDSKFLKRLRKQTMNAKENTYLQWVTDNVDKLSALCETLDIVSKEGKSSYNLYRVKDDWVFIGMSIFDFYLKRYLGDKFGLNVSWDYADTITISW